MTLSVAHSVGNETYNATGVNQQQARRNVAFQALQSTKLNKPAYVQMELTQYSTRAASSMQMQQPGMMPFGPGRRGGPGGRVGDNGAPRFGPLGGSFGRGGASLYGSQSFGPAGGRGPMPVFAPSDPYVDLCRWCKSRGGEVKVENVDKAFGGKLGAANKGPQPRGQQTTLKLTISGISKMPGIRVPIPPSGVLEFAGTGATFLEARSRAATSAIAVRYSDDVSNTALDLQPELSSGNAGVSAFMNTVASL